MKKKPGLKWRSIQKGRCQAHGQNLPCGQCKKDTLKRETYMARERRILNELLYHRPD